MNALSKFALAALSILLLVGSGDISHAAMMKGDLLPVSNFSKKAVYSAPLKVKLGKAELVSVPEGVLDVLVADSNVIDVSAVQADKLYVVGLQVGDTNLMALNGSGDVIRKFDIHVEYDLKAIQALIADLFPREDVSVRAIHDQILLTGDVSNPEVASRITNVVGHYVGDLINSNGKADDLISSLLNVRGEQQVMLQVRIVEATRNIGRELGLETGFSGASNSNTRFSVTPGGGLGLNGDAAAAFSLFQDTGLSALGALDLQLNALEEQGRASVLAEPNLTAISGEKAGFLAGGEFPVPTGRDQVGNLTIEFREFGVSLNFKPVVLSEERISLQLNTEVSSLDFDKSVTLSDVVVPGLDIRRADTTVEVPSGGSLMIAGLLSSEAISGMTGLPGVKSTPVIGDLLSSRSFQRDETELIVIVTPYLVKPYKEKERADVVETAAVKKDNPLAVTFSNNVKKNFKIRKKHEFLFEGKQNFGYMLN